MSIQLHPRYFIVRKATADINAAIESAWFAHELTHTEVIRILLEIAQRFTVDPLRAERHPEDPDKKADEL